MRKLKTFDYISLDGVIQARDWGEDGDYLYGAWTARYRSPFASTKAYPQAS